MRKNIEFNFPKSKPRVNVLIKDNIAWVRLNRPDKHNGLDEAMFHGLIASAKKLRKCRAVRAVILSGEGDSFCSGLDFKAVSKHPLMIPKFFLKLPWRKVNKFQEIAYIWQTLPMPVIAAIHGNCFGGGLQIVLGCDYRIATADAQLSIMEAKWGLIPDMGGTLALSRLTQVDTAFELTVTGRVFSGDEAYKLGIVSRIDSDPLAAGQQMAEQIAMMSPDAVSAAKTLYQKTWKKTDREALLWERWTQLRVLGRFNQRAAMKNALNREGKQVDYKERGFPFKLF